MKTTCCLLLVLGLLVGCAMPSRTDSSSGFAKKSKRAASAAPVTDPADITPERMAKAVTVPVENYEAAQAEKRVLSEKPQGGFMYFAVEIKYGSGSTVVVRRYPLPAENVGPGAPASPRLPAPVVEGQ